IRFHLIIPLNRCCAASESPLTACGVKSTASDTLRLRVQPLARRCAVDLGLILGTLCRVYPRPKPKACTSAGSMSDFDYCFHRRCGGSTDVAAAGYVDSRPGLVVSEVDSSTAANVPMSVATLWLARHACQAHQRYPGANIKSPYRNDSSWANGRMKSLSAPATSGPKPMP